MFTKLAVLFIGLVLGLIPLIAHATYESGIAAFQKADYQAAFQELYPLGAKNVEDFRRVAGQTNVVQSPDEQVLNEVQKGNLVPSGV